MSHRGRRDAFPHPPRHEADLRTHESGMTVRELLAGLALSGTVSTDRTPASAAARAREAADALLAELEKAR